MTGFAFQPNLPQLPVAQVSGDRWFPLGNQTGTSATLGDQTLRLSPIWVPNQITLSHLGAEITSAGGAGSVLRLGVYFNTQDSNGRFYPGALLAEPTTQLDGTSATVQEVAFATPVALSTGWWWIGGALQSASTQPTVRTSPLSPLGSTILTALPGAGGAGMGYSQGSIGTGALPATFTTTLATIGASPRLHLRLA